MKSKSVFSTNWRVRFLALNIFFFVSITNPAFAGNFIMNIDLLPQTGEAVRIGTLNLSQNKFDELPGGNAGSFTVSLNDTVFSEHFLSMRPFRCLRGPEHLLCYLPYPYNNQRILSGETLRDLEYDLLFIRKDPAEFGIDAWNGLYYKLQWQGQDITGELNEVDLNILAVPPQPGTTAPISDGDLTPADPDTHWLPRIRIYNAASQ